MDRRNFHPFVPLLRRTATAAPSPADLAEPIRHVPNRHRNVVVILREFAGTGAERRMVRLAASGRLAMAPSLHPWTASCKLSERAMLQIGAGDDVWSVPTKPGHPEKDRPGPHSRLRTDGADAPSADRQPLR